ncbi:tRNA(Ile)-lysidine synthetase [Bartonella bacilliformis]|uniref:tRNA(Ile)-lysidine synthase n=2 Tax=Bartonella bacilliformis TaxID=774 RepID=A0ABP2SPH4_BARBA|nr:tRNA(Ile)-lysidine synthetase [Bartonella bacilliformis INS]KZN22129.1 tRNA(Ile)-lysidine synthetase [Bartonella bacilliformis]
MKSYKRFCQGVSTGINSEQYFIKALRKEKSFSVFVELAKNVFKESDFAQCQKLILAVSGGSDSLALLFLLRDYFKTWSAADETVSSRSLSSGPLFSDIIPENNFQSTPKTMPDFSEAIPGTISEEMSEAISEITSSEPFSSGSFSSGLLSAENIPVKKIPPEIIVVTVDHQLRAESALEAENVAALCRAYHIKHVIVRWEGEKPKTNIAQQARIARYDLLFKEAEKQGATLIMTGHTLNDQVETYHMRRQRLHKGAVVAEPEGEDDTKQEADTRQKIGAEKKAKPEIEVQPEVCLERGAEAQPETELALNVVPQAESKAPKKAEKAAGRGAYQEFAAENVEQGLSGYDGESLSGYDKQSLSGCDGESVSGCDGESLSDQNLSNQREESDLFYERGLACIPREALLRGKVRLIRPLLGVKRKILRAYLSLQGTSWIDDPTNEDRKFERVRVRHSLHQQKLADIAKKVNHAAVQRRKQAQDIADLILALDICVEYGRCFIRKPAPFLQQHASFPFVVGLFVVLMGGNPYLLPSRKVAALGRKLSLQHPEKQRFTLAGSVIEYNHKGIVCWREARNIKEEILFPGQSLLWDGRYQITNHDDEAIRVGPADIDHLKYFLKQGAMEGILNFERPHFPSLQSLLMISKSQGVDIPDLTPHLYSKRKVIIKRIMAPFDWLLSREDAAIVNVVEPLLNIE